MQRETPLLTPARREADLKSVVHALCVVIGAPHTSAESLAVALDQ